MQEKLTKSKHIGVYQAESLTRRYDGKPDIRYYYTIKDNNGKKVWVKVGWKSEGYSAQMASNARAEALQKIRNGGNLSLSRQKQITFQEAFELFDKNWLTVNIKRPEDERKRYRLYIAPVFAGRFLDKITPIDLETFKADLISKKFSAATVRHCLSDIRRVYRKLIEWDIYQGNDPTQRVKMPNVDNARERFLTQQEAKLLLESLKKRSEIWHDIALISLHTGMRLSEILHIEWQDINFETTTIHVRDAKTGSRRVHFTKRVREIFQLRKEVSNTARVFTQRNGENLADSMAGKVFRDTVDSIGLNPPGTDRRHKVCFHTLRHTFCSWLAMEGVPLYVIGEMVGHKTTQMTKRYSHLCPSTAKEAIRIIDSISKK